MFRCSPVCSSWCMKILTNLVYCKGNIWPSKSQVLKRTNQASIFGGILLTQRLSFSKRKFLRTGQWCWRRFVTLQSNSAQKISCIFLLRKMKTSFLIFLDLNTQKIVQIT
uniref:Uncharacterized protein n=1 Tax=Triticum urartu TaxID=4572 RepID=A0A8R7UMT9_TRIUA